MKIFLDDNSCKSNLFPLTLTRHVADLRVGILTIREKWERLGFNVQTGKPGPNEAVVPANLVPNSTNYQQLLEGGSPDETIIKYPWDIFRLNDKAIREDFDLLTQGITSLPVHGSNAIMGDHPIFLAEGSRMEHCILNATAGPVYIGPAAEVMEGAMIRGPFALGAHSLVKMGAKLYGGTSTGPWCVIGGEIKNSMIQGYSNKAHDGYLGDSVVGEWCNLGAGTSNSNVKNTGGDVRFMFHSEPDGINAGQKAGLIMGDYSRCAINTAFNTGTIAGVCCNIFEAAPPKYIPSFTWGKEKYIFDKAIADINNWKRMKGQELSAMEIDTLYHLYHTNQ